MRAWLVMLGGLIVWTAHFFALYAIASLLPGEPLGRVLVLLVTAMALIAAAILLRHAAITRPDCRDPSAHWLLRLSTLVSAIALLAIAWQGMPALVG